jgi:hypothetical protein
MAKSLENPEGGNLLLWKRRPLPEDDVPGTSSSPDVPSQCILGCRPQSRTAGRGCVAERGRRASRARERAMGSGSPQIKMDAVSPITLRSGTACAGTRRRAQPPPLRAALSSGTSGAGSGTGSWDPAGGGGAHHPHNQPIIL